MELPRINRAIAFSEFKDAGAFCEHCLSPNFFLLFKKNGRVAQQPESLNSRWPIRGGSISSPRLTGTQTAANWRLFSHPLL